MENDLINIKIAILHILEASKLLYVSQTDVSNVLLNLAKTLTDTYDIEDEIKETENISKSIIEQK